MLGKPVILWIADTPQWAYDSIIQAVSRELPQYTHLAFYACATADPGHAILNELARNADVVVSMFLRYQEWLRPELKHKVATMVTGYRPFEVARG